MKFGVMCNIEFPEAIEVAKEIITFLSKENEVSIESDLAARIGKKGFLLEKMKVDVLVTVGGDGTILRALQHSNAKIFGVNAGVLGFLAEVTADKAKQGLQRIMRGKYIIDERVKLKTIFNGKRQLDCTNEAVLHTAHIARMRHFEVFINGNLAQDMRADGIIVATPTGSTSYSMSAGGPLIDPKVHAFVVVPLAPFKLSARPIVIPAESEIGIRLGEPKRTCVLVLDGQQELKVSGSDTMKFSVSENVARFIRFDENFYKRIEEKLVL